jgi:hypothetical protein
MVSTDCKKAAVPVCILHTPYAVQYAMVQPVEALRYKPQSQGFDSQWGHWDFSLT